MLDDRTWRLVVDVEGSERSAERLTGALQAALNTDDDAVSHDARRIFVYADSQEALAVARRVVTDQLRQAELAATVTSSHWNEATNDWHLPDGAPARSLLVRTGPPPPEGTIVSFERRGTQVNLGPRELKRAARVALALAFVCAAGGITWYALAPDVGSYQATFVLVLPALIVLLVWLYRRLPRRLSWTLAIALAVGGPTAYVVEGGSQWWYWGKMAVMPLMLLLLTRVKPGSVTRSERWYGGLSDGPWGPP